MFSEGVKREHRAVMGSRIFLLVQRFLHSITDQQRNILLDTMNSLTWTEAVVQRCSAQNVLTNFAKFTGKHLCQSLFLMKLQAAPVVAASEICRKVLLFYFFIILSKIELEKVIFVISEILGLLVKS